MRSFEYDGFSDARQETGEKMSISKTISSGLRVALVGVVALVLAAGLVACGGKSNEEVIREGVTQEFESIKNLDDATLDEILGGFTESADLSEYGIDNAEFCKSWLSGFDYTVDDVVVDGDNATVTVSVTIKSLEEALTNWQSKMEELAGSEEYASMTTEDLYAAIGTSLMESLDTASMSNETVELPYTLNGNTWEPGAGFDAALAQAFTGGLV